MNAARVDTAIIRGFGLQPVTGQLFGRAGKIAKGQGSRVEGWLIYNGLHSQPIWSGFPIKIEREGINIISTSIAITIASQDLHSGDAAMLTGAVTGPTVTSRVFDAQLMAAVVEGNCAAFEQLYDRHVRSCFGLAMRLVQEPCLAEDIVQEVFTRLWSRPTTFSPERGIFSAWLMRIVRNLALDKLRQAKSRSAMNIVPLNSDNAGSDTLVDLLPDTNPTPHDQVCTKDVAVVVHHALQQLPAPQYQAIALAYFGGLTQQEIADKLNLPLGTVKTRTRGALHRLHHLLADHGVFQTE